MHRLLTELAWCAIALDLYESYTVWPFSSFHANNYPVVCDLFWTYARSRIWSGRLDKGPAKAWTVQFERTHNPTKLLWAGRHERSSVPCIAIKLAQFLRVHTWRRVEASDLDIWRAQSLVHDVVLVPCVCYCWVYIDCSTHIQPWAWTSKCPNARRSTYNVQQTSWVVGGIGGGHACSVSFELVGFGTI